MLVGDWKLASYSEVTYDGTIDKFEVRHGSAHFDMLIGNSIANFQLKFLAIHDFDTVEKNIFGVYKHQTIDTLILDFENNLHLFDINRLFKTDLNLQGGLAPNRKSIFILKKL